MVPSCGGEVAKKMLMAVENRFYLMHSKGVRIIDNQWWYTRCPNYGGPILQATEDMALSCGRPSLTVSTACPLLLLWTIRSSVVMEVSA